MLAVRALQHELNNALAPVAGLAQLARASRHDRELQDLALARAARAGEEASAICQTVLSLFAQLPAPGPAIRDARRVVGELVTSRRRLRPDIEYIEVFHVERAPVEATGLGMVVLNLLLNAETACRDGGRIEVRLMSTGDGGLTENSADIHNGSMTSYNQTRVGRFDGGIGRQIHQEAERLDRQRAGGSGHGGQAGHADSSAGVGALDDAGVLVEVIDSGRGMGGGELAAAMGGVPSDGQSAGGRGGGSGGGGLLSGRQGLGLMICRRLLAAVGGTMAVRSQPGAGTQVSVWWPSSAGARSPGGVAA